MNNNHLPVMLNEVLSFIPTDKKINLALKAQMKKETLAPLQEYSRLQRNTLHTVGLGAMGNKTSFALAGITILLGITAIIGRVE